MVNNKIIDRQIFNVGSNENNFNKIQIANAIKKFVNGKIKIVKESRDKRNYKVDFSKLEKKINFKFKLNLDYGFRSILENLKKKKKSNIQKNFLIVNYKVKNF